MLTATREYTIIVPFEGKNTATLSSGDHTLEYVRSKPDSEKRTQTHTTALCTIAKSWRPLKCPQTDEWIKKSHVHRIKYNSAMKKHTK